jgi:ribosomal-protein-alanine N-acetyltransferase
LVSIAVDPRRRGKGIASGLLESSIRRLRRRGAVRLHLMVKVTNDTALRFYERHGFQKGRIVRGYYEDGADGRGMSKPLV